MRQDWRIDAILLLLFFGMILFTGVLIWVEFAFKEDGQIYQTIAGLLTGFAGAFFMRIAPHKQSDDATSFRTETKTVSQAPTEQKP